MYVNQSPPEDDGIKQLVSAIAVLEVNPVYFASLFWYLFFFNLQKLPLLIISHLMLPSPKGQKVDPLQPFSVVVTSARSHVTQAILGKIKPNGTWGWLLLMPVMATPIEIVLIYASPCTHPREIYIRSSLQDQTKDLSMSCFLPRPKGVVKHTTRT